jgi:hypothetical protein
MNILFIEDQPDAWKEVIIDAVKPIECKFKILSNDQSGYEELSTLDLSEFDLAICNYVNQALSLKSGASFMGRIRDTKMNLPIIFLTACERNTSTELIEDHSLYMITKEKYYVFKGDYDRTTSPGFRENFKKTFKEAVLDSLFPSIDGVIRDIFLGLDLVLPNDSFLYEYRHEITEIIYNSEDRRLFNTCELWKKLWIIEKGLPHLPLIDTLTEEELSGKMYEEYRDHVTHSIWTYLLGLYLYNKNPLIKHAIDSKYSSSVDFLQAWKIAALFHDIGYTCDVGINNEEKFLSPIFNRIYPSIHYPIKSYLNARGYYFTEDNENHLTKLSQRVTTLSPKLTDLETKPGTIKEWVLNEIEDHAINTCLAQEGVQTPLKNYYRMSQFVKPISRETYRDHGILSSIILLYQFYNFNLVLSGLQGKQLPQNFSRKSRIFLEEMINSSIDRKTASIVLDAALAISLHNIDPKIWMTDHLESKISTDPHNLSIMDYKIKLMEMPLAFLLALVDVLQCWDRPRRRKASDPEKLSIPHKDVRIICEGDIIYWAINQDRILQEQLRDTKQEIQHLAKYLSIDDERDLSFLIRETIY